MTRLKTIFIALLLALSVQSGWALGRVILHHSYWEPQALPANGTYNWDGITHLIIFGLEPHSGRPNNYYFDADLNITWAQAITAEAQSHGVKVLLCTGGIIRGWEWRDNIAPNPTLRRQVVDAHVSLMQLIGADGIDLDWESSTNGPLWAALSIDYREAIDLTGAGKILAADIGRQPSPAWPIATINQYYDMVQPMLYDAATAYDATSGFHNGIYDPRPNWPTMDAGTAGLCADSCMVRFQRAGIIKSKVSLGVALYPQTLGYYSPPIYQPGQNIYQWWGWPGSVCTHPNNWCGRQGDFRSTVYPRLLAGYTEHFDSRGRSAWMGSESENFYFSYPNAQSFADFIEYVEDSSWGGIMLFAQEHQYFYTPIEWPMGSGTFTRTPLLDDFRRAMTPVAPSITTQPSNVSTHVGNTATFSVVASAQFYQWQKNSVNISSATNASYTTPTLVVGDNGNQYRCIVSNSIGTVTSNQATLTVTNSLPVISVHPANTTKSAGQTATFSVTASGTLPLSYQWEKREFAGSYVTISGAISSSYTTAALQTSDNATSFRCIVSNSIGTATSNAGMLTVLASIAPTSDDFHTGALNTSLWTLTNPASASTVSFEGAGTRDAVFKIAIPSGTAYDANGSPCIMQNISNADFGLETKVQNAIQPLANYVSSGFLIRGGSDYIRILFAYNSSTASIYGASYISGVTSQVVNTSITNAPVLYMRLVRVGNVWTVTYSYDGSTWLTSGSFTLAFTVESVGLHVSNCCGGTSPAITGTFDYFFNTASPITDEDPTTGAPPAIITQPSNVSGNAGATAQFSVTATNTPAYQWQKNSVNIPGATSSTYTTPALVYATDNGAAFRCIVSNAIGTVSSNEAILTVNVAPVITVQPASVTVDSNGTAQFTVSYTAVPVPTFQWQVNSVNISGATSNGYTLTQLQPSDSGKQYRCILSNSAGTVTSSQAILSVLRTAPNITSNPANISVVEGQQATFSVTSTGKAPYFFQWQRDGVDDSGATSSSYTITTVLADNGAVIRCRVFSAYGADTSGNATLTVTASPPPATAPSISTQPTAQSVQVGQSATFVVGATGTATLAYQWQKNTVNISSATSSAYTTPASVIGDDGASFRCVVSNSVGTVTSSGATLTVTALPESLITFLQVLEPVSGEILTAGQNSSVRILAHGFEGGGSQIITFTYIGTTTYVLGMFPDTGNIVPGGQNPPATEIEFPYQVPFDVGSNRKIVASSGTVSDTSDPFIISTNTIPSIILVSTPTNLQIGTRQYIYFQYSTNADSVALYYKRDTDANYQATSNNRNIAPNKNFSALWGGFIAYPLAWDLELRLYAWLDGGVTYEQVRIEITP